MELQTVSAEGMGVVNTCTLSQDGATMLSGGTIMTIKELLDSRYAPLHNLKPRTVGLFTHTIDRFRDFLGREPQVEDLDDLNVSRFVRWRAATPHKGRIAAPATVRKDLAHLCSLANHAAKKRLLPEFLDLPKNLVRVPDKPPRGYTAEEVAALVRSARMSERGVGPVSGSWFWSTLILSCWYTGERIGGHLGIRWKTVDLENAQLTFLGEYRKGDTQTITRAIPEDLVELLRAGQRKPEQRVWPWIDHRTDENSIFEGFRCVAKRAGVTPRGFHAIRKASGSYVMAGGGNATLHLGHANERTTRQHYLDPRIVRQDDVLQFLPPLDLGEQ